MGLYKLNNKQVLRLKNKACEFLKGFSSNVLEASRNASLDVHGKIVVIFDQKVLSEEEVLIVIEKQYLSRLKAHWEKFMGLGDTRLEEADLSAYFDSEGGYEPIAGDILIPQRKGSLVLTRREIVSHASEADFTLFRLKNNLPVQGIDYDEEMLLNVGDEEFVSYTKGCYLGQEIIARVHNRSKPPKTLTVKSQAQCTAEELTRMTSKTLDPATGKITGFVFVKQT